jgi:UDPglucose 6-dehydrogenase
MMALHNHDIHFTVVDRDPKRIKQWYSKHLPIHEPGLHDILRIVRDGSKSLSFLNAPANCRDESISYSSSASSECESHCEEYKERITIPSRTPNLFFSTNVSQAISEADIILIAVNTPTKRRGMEAGRATDMTALEAVSKEVAIHAKAEAIIVEKSTVPCRTSEMIRKIVRPLHSYVS